MPELPEVETVAQRLAEILPGKLIVGLEVLREKSFQGEIDSVVGMKVTAVSRRAKMIRIHGEDAKRNLLIHLKMTGQIIVRDGEEQTGGGHPSADWTRELPSSHTRVLLQFDDGSTLFFNDMRVFGWIKALGEDEVEQEFKNYAPDVNTDEINLEYFRNILKRRSAPIKQVLLDNKIMAGVGNIYACEALFLAKVHPRRRANTLSAKEIKAVLKNTKKVIQEGIELGGTTFDGKYVGVDGLAGGYQDRLRVYGQEGEPCVVCKTPIEKIKLGGRGTYFCTHCQK